MGLEADRRRQLLRRVRDVERLADSHDVPSAREQLHGLVGEIDVRHAVLSDMCLRLALRIEAFDLALHFALCNFVATGGRKEAVQAVASAAAENPVLSSQAGRIASFSARAADLCAVAETDPYGSWPQIAALAPTGAYAEASLEQLGRRGLAEPVMSDGLVAWRVNRARVTWSGHSCAVGCIEPDESVPTEFVPELSYGNHGPATWWHGGATTEMSGTVGLIARRWALTNYFHWLSEGLQDIFALEEAAALGPSDRYLVCLPRAAPPFVQESLVELGFDVSRFEIRTEPFDAIGLTVVKPMIERVPVALQVRRLRERALPARRQGPQVRRVFVSRRDAIRRRLVGDSELAEALSVYGFESVVPGGLSFRQQVDLFSSAEMIVAPHGAGLANIVFAHPTATLIELTPPDAEPADYQVLAEAVGVRYVASPCESVPGTGGDRHGDLRADTKAVIHLVRSLLNE